MLVIPTCQHATLDLVQRGEKVETEKDRLLEQVSRAASLQKLLVCLGLLHCAFAWFLCLMHV